ncbi:hypothetical protein CASFOL_038620 [Castilleja foliolosa]|uniref:BHLH domain-containing protein n=1 Tax=Castilleja foliolosa TaxID=1961234 RepID=A0ABD3BM03_9LAMI
MMAGNPNYWSMNGMHPQSHQLSNSQFVYGSNNNINNNINININDNNNITSDSTTTTTATNTTDHPDDFPVRSWSQLLMGGLGSGEEERFGANVFHQQKKMENWDQEHQVLNLNNSISNFGRINNNNNNDDDEKYDDDQVNRTWPHHIVMPISSPTSCVTSLSNKNFLNFSGGGGKAVVVAAANQVKINQEHSSEYNSTSTTGGVSKKARVQQTQPALKVRKEKLGDRITALHQLVSPFGKTDTASVLSEAIGYIRFLQAQIEALSSPYMKNASANSDHSVQERNCLYPEESSTGQDSQTRGVNDLRSRGLCLVPISCTENVGNDNGADYWAPTALGGGF